MIKVTCLNCGWNWTKDCSIDYETEKDYYLNYKPECPKCYHDKWKTEEILEVVIPLTKEQKELFKLGDKNGL
jgi:predicted nucleic-acid-binding Zn-ribbon protein